jgi:hypothetical protein
MWRLPTGALVKDTKDPKYYGKLVPKNPTKKLFPTLFDTLLMAQYIEIKSFRLQDFSEITSLEKTYCLDCGWKISTHLFSILGQPMSVCKDLEEKISQGISHEKKLLQFDIRPARGC